MDVDLEDETTDSRNNMKPIEYFKAKVALIDDVMKREKKLLNSTENVKEDEFVKLRMKSSPGRADQGDQKAHKELTREPRKVKGSGAAASKSKARASTDKPETFEETREKGW